VLNEHGDGDSKKVSCGVFFKSNTNKQVLTSLFVSVF